VTLRAQFVVVAAAAAAVAALIVTTRRPPAQPLPDLRQYLVGWAELHGGYDAVSARLVGGVLSGVYRAARPLARFGATPNALTAAGPVVAGVAAVLAGAGRWERAGAAGVVAISGVIDNLDGAVAVLTDRASRIGYVLDSVVDRLADGLWLLALWQAGAETGTVLGAATAVVILEYTRARAGAAGMQEIGVVTVAERPTRMILVAAALLVSAVLAGWASDVATAGAAALIGVTAGAVGQLSLAIRRSLSQH
jgi:phosphatidylglycerophosphate synthase